MAPLEHNKADTKRSVVFGRQGDKLGPSKEKKAAKHSDSGCYEGCSKGILSLLGFPSEDGAHGGNAKPRIYSEQKPLSPLDRCMPWTELPEDKRCGMRVETGTSAKEGMDGWKNQDALVACCVGSGSASGDVEYMFFGAFDGHGRQGHDAAQTAASRLPSYLAVKNNSALAANPKKTLETAFKKADDDIFSHLGSDVEYSGTTGVGVVVDVRSRVLHIGNVGDSRAILGQKYGGDGAAKWIASPLTEDMKADLETERITMCGGHVSPIMEHGKPVGPARVWENAGMEKPGLAVSRSLGDGCARSVGVIPDPVVTQHKLQDHDKFMIVATDGLWDAIDNDKAVQIIAKFLHIPHVAIKALTEAVRREEEGELADDTSIVLVIF